jgi:hypothetical protein
VGENFYRESKGANSLLAPFANDDEGTEKEETRAPSSVRAKTMF